jgi:hypothetical protein
MAYFIFLKNSDNLEGLLYKIAENETDLNNLNIIQSDYKIIESSQENFNFFKYGTKKILKYNNDTIVFDNHSITYNNKEDLENEVFSYKKYIKNFLNNNNNHLLYNRWNDYYNQLNDLNLNSIIYPLNKSLEQYFNDLGQPSYSILQVP